MNNFEIAICSLDAEFVALSTKNPTHNTDNIWLGIPNFYEIFLADCDIHFLRCISHSHQKRICPWKEIEQRNVRYATLFQKKIMIFVKLDRVLTNSLIKIRKINSKPTYTEYYQLYLPWCENVDNILFSHKFAQLIARKEFCKRKIVSNIIIYLLTSSLRKYDHW